METVGKPFRIQPIPRLFDGIAVGNAIECNAHPRLFAVTSISIFISGFMSWHTRQVAAGLMLPKAEPITGTISSQYAAFSKRRFDGLQGIRGLSGNIIRHDPRDGIIPRRPGNPAPIAVDHRARISGQCLEWRTRRNKCARHCLAHHSHSIVPGGLDV
jgi:hypothetical protein